jgi:hypothetical protein
MYTFTGNKKQFYPNYATNVIVNHYYTSNTVPTIGSTVNTVTKFVPVVTREQSAQNEEQLAIHKLVINPTVNKILVYLKEFTVGNFTNVREVFSQFAILSAELYNLKNDNATFTDYEFIRNSIVTSFESYIQSIYQYTNMGVLESKLVNATAMVDILHDMAKLEAYIQDLNTRGRVGEIFPEVTVTAPLFKLKPEYEAYIEAYGFPEGAVFDPDLLAPFITAQQLLLEKEGLA